MDGVIYKNIFMCMFKQRRFIKTFSRKAVIPKFFIKKSIQTYKGNIFTKINFTKYNVGYKIGEFNITRKPFSFPQKKKK